MGTLTITLSTSTPVSNLTHTWTDTDSNMVLAAQSLQGMYSASAPALGVFNWAQGVVNDLVNMVTGYQQSIATVTVINPK